MEDQIVVVGGGIAGVSAAAFLAEGGARVTLVERETSLAYHTTGRSAAQWIENYGSPANRQLTRAGRDFFNAPPPGSVDTPLLQPRPFLLVGRDDQQEELAVALADGADGDPPSEQISPEEAAALCPMVNPERTNFAILERASMEIDVGGLHQAFVRMLRAAGGTIATATRVDSARPEGDRWVVDTTDGELRADIVVNAGGAWGDLVAESAGVSTVGLEPRRRTAFMVPMAALPDANLDRADDWPMLVNVAHDWYVKPDGAQLLCSPADQTPSPAVDAKPEELDIAIAIERINDDTNLQIRSVSSRWAGLRTFAPDESLVLGAEPTTPRFIWCVGQGGVGIQTSPAAGRLIADLVLDRPTHPAIDVGLLSPARFR